MMLSALAIEPFLESSDDAGHMLCRSELALPPTGAGAAASLPTGAGAAPFDLSQTFALHSLAGADLIIYLDFDGHTTSNTPWNSQYNLGNAIVSPGYSADGSPLFSDSEREYIQHVWQRVAEDFAPFNVDVTTEDPGVDRLRKSGSGDTHWGIRAVITPDQSWISDNRGSSGGWGFYGSFQWDTDSPVFIFNGSQSTSAFSEVTAADTFSHEVGHSLGLQHDGRISPSEDYYHGHGSGPTGWAPIMGASFNRELSQWSHGEYPSANNTEDDLRLITDPALGGGFWTTINGVPVSTWSGVTYQVDDHATEVFGNGAIEASLLGPDLSASGLIETAADVDSFRFDWAGGNFTLFVTPALRGPNLDVLAQLYDAAGNLIAASNPLDLLGASFSGLSLFAGEYFLNVQGTGKPANGTDYGYSDYGSLGRYTIAATDPGDDAYEQNETLATAADPLGNGGEWEHTWLSSIAGFGISRNDDWYAINVSAEYPELQVQLSLNNAEGDLDLFVFDASGNRVASSETSNDLESLRVFLSAGRYYILVKAWPDGSSPGNQYDLWWDDFATTVPTVWMTSGPASPGNVEVTEDGTTNLTFTFTRTSGIAESLTVFFAVGGTATFGVDYTQSGADRFDGMSGSATFAPGSSTAVVTIDPTTDTTIEPDEIIQVFITSGMYETDAFASAAGYLLNDDFDPNPAMVGIRYGYGMNRWIDAAALVGRTAPWEIQAIAITFDRNVDVDISDLSILGIGGSTIPLFIFNYDELTFTATWTFLAIEQNQVTFRLDGDGSDGVNDFNLGVRAAAGTYPRDGGYLTGGDHDESLDVLFGDIDGNRTVNLIDALLQRGYNGTTDIWSDINGSGTVDITDALMLRGRNGATLN